MGSPAQRYINNNRALAQAGFLVPETVYQGEVAGVGEFIFSKKIDGEPVCLLLERLAREQQEPRHKRMLLQSLGIAVGRLHRSGFVHGQLTSQNILASHTNDRFSIIFTNNENVVRRRAPSGKQVAQELKRLHVSLPECTKKTDMLRLFNAWRRQMRHLQDVEASILAEDVYTRRSP